VQKDAEIIEQFVRSFGKHDELFVPDYYDPITEQFSLENPNQSEQRCWQPVRQQTSRDKLDSVYSKLPDRLPPLFEELLLTFRWARVGLKRLYLLANPLGDDLSGFEKEIFKDHGLSAVLIKGSFIQFAKAAEFNYDPICFDTRKRTKNGGCQIVQLDHEEILCNSRIKEVAQIASSFRELVTLIIEDAG
jgi:hypothetical protein